MCGRYTQLYSWSELFDLLNLSCAEVAIPRRYNVAPTQSAAVIRLDEPKNMRLSFPRWGLIPAWTKDLKSASGLINARSETIAEKPSFRGAFKAKRCLIPASGYYEWMAMADGPKKQPFYITPLQTGPLIFAGLWESWKDESGTLLESFAIITRPACHGIKEIHDRMPVLLDKAQVDTWMSSSSGEAELLELCKIDPSIELGFQQVSTHVNSVRNDDPACIEAVGGQS